MNLLDRATAPGEAGIGLTHPGEAGIGLTHPGEAGIGLAQAVAQPRFGDGDLQQPVVLGHAFAAGRSAGLAAAAAGADGQVGDEVVLGLARSVRDELSASRVPADGHGLERLGHGTRG